MRYMIIVLEGDGATAGPPSSEMIAAMGRLNKEMLDAGVLLAMEGLHPGKSATRVTFTGKRRKVTDGPFTEAKEMIGGFWIIEAKDEDEVMAWVDKIPFENGEQVEIRRVAEAEEFERNEVTAEALDMERKFHAEHVKPLRG